MSAVFGAVTVWLAAPNSEKSVHGMAGAGAGQVATTLSMAACMPIVTRKSAHARCIGSRTAAQAVLQALGVPVPLHGAAGSSQQAAVTVADCAMSSGYVAHGASVPPSPSPPVGVGAGVVVGGGGGGCVVDWPLSSPHASDPSSPTVPPVKKTRCPSKRPGFACNLNSNRIAVTVSSWRPECSAT